MPPLLVILHCVPLVVVLLYMAYDFGKLNGYRAGMKKASEMQDEAWRDWESKAQKVVEDLRRSKADDAA